MAHYASKRFNYWGQTGILLALCGAGLIVGGFASLIPLIGKIDIAHVLHGGTGSTDVMDNILKPENANALRWVQFISTLFMFFLPPFFYAWICHKKAFTNLGFVHTVDSKQIVLVILIMLACTPLVAVLQQLTEMMPFSKATFLQFKAAEDEYNRQVAVIARMNNFADYIVSVVMIAFLPAVFEETFFRGGVQNLLSRWIKAPIVAIIITSVIFSAVHGSYLGFLSRFALSFILGWMYYRTGNIWLNIVGHFTNNFLGVTSLYITSLSGAKADPSKLTDENFPLWVGLISLAAVCALFMAFDKASKKDIFEPGEEVLLPDDYNNTHNHSLTADIEITDSNNSTYIH
jgi:membrane protease YdiL (CAAX protease family)